LARPKVKTEIKNHKSKIENSKMKIIRIIARLNVGGPAKHVVWLTSALQGGDCESLLVAGTVPPGEDDMAYFAEAMAVKPFFVPEMSRQVSLKDLLTIWKLYRLFLRERPDIVHTHTAKAGTVGRVAGLLFRCSTPGVFVGRLRQCKFVHTYHGHIFHSYYGATKTRLFLTIEKLLARLGTDRIVVLSEQQRHEIQQQFRVGRVDQFRVIPLGLDMRVFAEWKRRRRLFREELGVQDGDVLVGIVGRLAAIKNHDLFFRAAAHYRREYRVTKADQLVRFIVIGDGQLRSVLENQARAFGLDEVVNFVGTRTDPENFYPALDVVALTSRNEGTPLTLIEAMANGRPVIATAVGGVIDLLGDATVASPKSRTGYTVCQRGIRVRPDDPAAFAEGLACLIDDGELREALGYSGREFVEQNYSKERLIDDISGLYGELVEVDTIVSQKSEVRSQESEEANLRKAF
jgi:glycosyltransferase involved in cell wall biosynthesis